MHSSGTHSNHALDVACSDAPCLRKPLTSAKRKRQNREAQARYRARQKERERELIETLLGGDGPTLADLVQVAGSKRKLLTLVHPDKHGNSELANRVTAYIIEHA